VSLEQEHNASNEPFIPEGLEYREEYWYDALAKVEAHERMVRWKKFALYAAAAMVVGLAIGYATLRLQNQQQMAQVQSALSNNTSAVSGENTSESASSVGTSEIENAISTDQKAQTSSSQSSQVSEGNATEKSASNNSTEKGIMATPKSERVSQQSDESSRSISTTSVVLPREEKNSSVESSLSTSENKAQEAVSVSATLAQGSGPVNTSKVQDAISTASPFIVEYPNVPVSKLKSLPGIFSSTEPTLSLLSVRIPRTNTWPISDFNLQLSAGVSAWRDFSTHTGDIAIDPFVRLSAERNFNRRFTIESGAEWTSISGPTARFERVYTTYDFNYTNTVTSVATNKLHYFTLPVLAKWRFNDRLQVQAGMGMSVLLAGTNTITVSEETRVTAQVSKKYNDKGYISGFNRFNTFAQAGVQYWIGKQTAIGVNFQYGLTDITKNAYFGQAYFDRNSRLTIELKRNIL
jgi:uncharacterized membrane-anchored protein YhcB (DUF1043 family)